MKRSRFSEEQIIGILKERQAGLSAAELCRKHGLSEPTCLTSGARSMAAWRVSQCPPLVRGQWRMFEEIYRELGHHRERLFPKARMPARPLPGRALHGNAREGDRSACLSVSFDAGRRRAASTTPARAVVRATAVRISRCPAVDCKAINERGACTSCSARRLGGELEEAPPHLPRGTADRAQARRPEACARDAGTDGDPARPEPALEPRRRV